MDYSQTLDFLYTSLPVFQHIGGEAYKAGLDNINALDDALGNPSRKFRSVHVAGTNGKGSVSHMTAAVLTAAGYKTGLFTSPHLKDFRERMRIDGQIAPEQYVVDFVARNREVIDRIKPSFFEITTAMAFDYFAQQGVDITVVEVGMGGRLDSTNILHPLVSAITNIGLDHTQYLGNTLEKIAGEKAGIIKPDTPVVIGESVLETQLVFITRAKELYAPILFADQCYRIKETASDGLQQRFSIESLQDGNIFELTTDLGGTYQQKNILTVLTILDVLNGAGRLSISPEAVRHGLATVAVSTGLQGRWQVLGQSPLIVADTGHNVHGMEEVVRQIQQQQYGQLYMILGFVSDKDIDGVLELLPRDAYYFFTKASIPRALDEKLLAEHAAKFGLQGETVDHVHAAIIRAKEKANAKDMIFIGGSTFVVAEAL